MKKITKFYVTIVNTCLMDFESIFYSIILYKLKYFNPKCLNILTKTKLAILCDFYNFFSNRVVRKNSKKELEIAIFMVGFLKKKHLDFEGFKWEMYSKSHDVRQSF